MKKTLLTIAATIAISTSAMAGDTAKIDWEKRDLCKNSEYKELCSRILDRKLVGVNTIVNFKFDKGKIIALVNLKKGENMSLLADPDPSYVAKYTGEHLVYKSADGVSITEFEASTPMKHLICDNSNKCIDAKEIRG